MKKNKKKQIIIAIILIVLLASGILTYVILKKPKNSNNITEKKENVNNDKDQKKYKIKDQVDIEIMQNILKINDFFDQIDNVSNYEISYYENNNKVDFTDKYNIVGNYKVVIKINDKEYTTTLNVIDKTAPDLTVKDLTINEKDGYNVNSFVKNCTDNSQKECILSFEDNKTYNSAGTYEVNIIAKDDSGNETKKKAKLIINKKTVNVNSKLNTKNDNKANNNTTANNTNNSKSNNNKVTFVKDETETEQETKDLKYGVKINVWHTKKYKLYSDGSKKLVNEYTHSELDSTNFSAKTSDMIPEAVENMSTYKAMVDGVLNYTNSFRSEVGKEPLTLDNDLTKAAMVRAIEMAYSKKFSHDRPDGSNCFSVLKDLGINIYFSGENIAMGQRSAEEVANDWKGSQGHYENMINPSFTKIGIGVIKLQGSYYWVQMFSN